MLKSIISAFFLLSAQSATSQTMNQLSLGDCSPNVGSAGGNVTINCNLGPTDSQRVTDATSTFFNGYLKFLNFSFSAQEDAEGYTGQIPRLDDGTIDFDKFRSAPAYSTSKTTVAEFLFSREEVTYEYASKIDEMIREAARDGEFLPFDAITFAQDTPQSVTVGVPTYTNTDEAIVCVWTFEDLNKKCDLLARLRKEGSSWKIFDVVNNGTLGWLFYENFEICNDDSDTTNVRSGPSAKAFDVVAVLPNGWSVSVVEDVVSPKSPVIDGIRRPHYYFKVRFDDPETGLESTGYIYDQAVYVFCTNS